MQDKNQRFRAFKKFVLGHFIANGYTYFEIADAISINDAAKVKSLLVKLCIYTVCQVALKHLKSGKNDDENNRQ
jgi:hypothetical protein